MFTVENFITLGFLVLLQAVLGFDNLLYISLESKRAPEDKQKFVRQLGIGLAIFLRIALLFILVSVIERFQDPIWNPSSAYFEGQINIHSLIVLGGGIFIIYTAMKEIWHMIALEDDAHAEVTQKSVGSIVTMIVIMNLVFSFDSILSAMALTDVFWVMATAIIISGIMMIWLAEKVTDFLKKNRMYEVLGLFILFIVGIMLVTEGGHLAHLKLFGNKVEAMSKTTFYFVLGILVIVDIVQSRYQKKIIQEQERLKKKAEESVA